MLESMVFFVGFRVTLCCFVPSSFTTLEPKACNETSLIYLKMYEFEQISAFTRVSGGYDANLFANQINVIDCGYQLVETLVLPLTNI
jgi:hypothetical protein